MKKLYCFFARVLFTLVTLSSCVGSSNENRPLQKSSAFFAPKERTSSLSDEDRQTAIAAKKASLSIDVVAAALSSRGVKLSVLPPMPQGEDITEAIAERIAIKLLQITTANGIGGLGNVPGFALTASVEQTGRAATGTAPQKMAVKYVVTYQVMNLASGDVYSTTTQEIMGVGNSFEEANRNSVDEIKNTPAMQQMLQTGCERIIAWYKDNFQTFKNQIEAAKGQKDFALALALAEAAPSQATAAFEYATNVQPELLVSLQLKHVADELAAMRAAIANAGSEYSAEVAAHMQMIPADSPEFKQAEALYAAYQQKVDAAIAEKKAKAAADEAYARQSAEAKEAYARQAAEAEAARAQERHLAQLEFDKIKIKYEAQSCNAAHELAIRKRVADENKGFWSRIGTRIIDAIDGAGSKE